MVTLGGMNSRSEMCRRGLIHQQRAVLARRYASADLGQVQAHGFGVAPYATD